MQTINFGWISRERKEKRSGESTYIFARWTKFPTLYIFQTVSYLSFEIDLGSREI